MFLYIDVLFFFKFQVHFSQPYFRANLLTCLLFCFFCVFEEKYFFSKTLSDGRHWQNNSSLFLSRIPFNGVAWLTHTRTQLFLGNQSRVVNLEADMGYS